MNQQLLPNRDQKAYDLGARSAREAIDELRRERDVLQGERDAQIDRADRMDAELGIVRDQLREATDTIRNQNSHMGWLEQQLKASGYRERAYARAINDLVAEAHRRHREILEGSPACEACGAVAYGNIFCATCHAHWPGHDPENYLDRPCFICRPGAYEAKANAVDVPAPVTDADVCGC